MNYVAKSLLPALVVLGAAVAPQDAADCAQPDGTAMDLNRVGIMYARGRGVAKNSQLASKLFRHLAMEGYTPAMVNLGTMYEQGMSGRRDHRRAYAWIRAALALGLPEEDYDETLFKLGMIAGRMGSAGVTGAEILAGDIADAIAGRCELSRDHYAGTTANALVP